MFGVPFWKQNNKDKTMFYLHIYSPHTEALTFCRCRSLVRLGLLVLLADLEVTQLVRLLIRRHHSQPITQVVLLQVLLGEVLQIPSRERSGLDVSWSNNSFLFSAFPLTSWRTASQTWRWSCSSCGRPARCFPGSLSSRWPLSSLWGRFPVGQTTVMH